MFMDLAGWEHLDGGGGEAEVCVGHEEEAADLGLGLVDEVRGGEEAVALGEELEAALGLALDALADVVEGVEGQGEVVEEHHAAHELDGEVVGGGGRRALLGVLVAGGGEGLAHGEGERHEDGEAALAGEEELDLAVLVLQSLGQRPGRHLRQARHVRGVRELLPVQRQQRLDLVPKVHGVQVAHQFNLSIIIIMRTYNRRRRRRRRRWSIY